MWRSSLTSNISLDSTYLIALYGFIPCIAVRDQKCQIVSRVGSGTFGRDGKVNSISCPDLDPTRENGCLDRANRVHWSICRPQPWSAVKGVWYVVLKWTYDPCSRHYTHSPFRILSSVLMTRVTFLRQCRLAIEDYCMRRSSSTRRCRQGSIGCFEAAIQSSSCGRSRPWVWRVCLRLRLSTAAGARASALAVRLCSTAAAAGSSGRSFGVYRMVQQRMTGRPLIS